jgi:hypothetical protein
VFSIHRLALACFDPQNHRLLTNEDSLLGTIVGWVRPCWRETYEC